MKGLNFFFWGFIFLAGHGYAQWIPQEIDEDAHLRSIHFFDSERGCAAGLCKIYKTSDGGEDWYNVYDGMDEYFTGVFLSSYSDFWVVGLSNPSFYSQGIILHSTNGTFWNQQYAFSMGGLYDIFFHNQNTGWVVGGYHESIEDFWGIVSKTDDGGETWFEQSSFPDNYLYTVHFANDQTGWIAGSGGVIFHTSNGGTDWEQQESGTNYNLKAMSFIDDQTGWITGTRSTSFYDITILLHTNNGGTNWETQYIDSSFLARDIDFVNHQTGWMIAGWYDILNTTDGGVSWDEQINPTGQSLSSVFFIDSLTGWIGGSGCVLNTTNGGGLYTSVEKNNKSQNITKLVCSPNPFSQKSTLEYELVGESSVHLVIYDHSGQKVMEFADERATVGGHCVEIMGDTFSKGIYICVLKTNEGMQTKKIIKL